MFADADTLTHILHLLHPFRHLPLMDGYKAKRGPVHVWIRVIDRSYDFACPVLDDESFIIRVWRNAPRERRAEAFVGRLRGKGEGVVFVDHVSRSMTWKRENATK